MRCNVGLLVGLLLATPMAACSGVPYYATASPAAERGLMLDDVTNGLQPNASTPADSPLAAAFFNDGGEGDIRLRTESHFGRDAETQEPASSPAERLLIYKGQIALEVARPAESMAAFLAQVKAWGGYMQSQVGTQVIVRLPAKLFEDAFEHLRGTGRVLSESRRAQDVTEEYLDLEIRLDNARTSRGRLLEILKKAEKVEDILKIEEQLRRLTDEIERMEGRRRFLADQVALATLQVDFHAVAEPRPGNGRRRPNRFHWINLVGAERVMEDF